MRKIILLRDDGCITHSVLERPAATTPNFFTLGDSTESDVVLGMSTGTLGINRGNLSYSRQLVNVELYSKVVYGCLTCNVS